MALDIQPLTADRFPDLATLFEQGGDPKWCWCASFRIRGSGWSNTTPQANRAILASAVTDDATQGRAPGLVAYEDGQAVGWVSLAPREDFERLAHARVLAPLDDTPVWSIVCFVVGRRSRGKGVATALLDAAIAYAGDHGATRLEAYPVELPDRGRIPSANAYGGTLGMYERAGFTVAARRQANASTRPRPIVRLVL